jgi:hypothetical protein
MIMGWFDAPKTRKKKARRRSAWIEESERHVRKSNAQKRCRTLRAGGWKTKIATLPNGVHVVFKR